MNWRVEYHTQFTFDYKFINCENANFSLYFEQDSRDAKYKLGSIMIKLDYNLKYHQYIICTSNGTFCQKNNILIQTIKSDGKRGYIADKQQSGEILQFLQQNWEILPVDLLVFPNIDLSHLKNVLKELQIED